MSFIIKISVVKEMKYFIEKYTNIIFYDNQPLTKMVKGFCFLCAIKLVGGISDEFRKQTILFRNLD